MVDFVHKNDIFRIALGIFLSGLILVGSANASTLTVCLSGCSYQQIQKAINASNPGDTIEVRSGTYFENVNISKQLILRGIDTGTGKPVVDAAGSGNVISMTAPNITIDGFQVINGDAGINADWLSGNITIQNNNASSNKKGIRLYYTGGNLINNNASNNIQGIYVSGSGSIMTGNNANGNEEGIIFDSITNIKLINNKMAGNNYNFVLQDLHSALVNNFNKWEIDSNNLVDNKLIYYLNGTKNEVYDPASDAGMILCINCVNVTIRNMNLSKNEAGIIFINTTGSTIQNVSTSNNKKGIYLLGSKDNLIDNNSAWNNTISGIELESSYQGDIYSCNSNNLTNNTVWNNEIGIHLKGDPYGLFRSSPHFNTVKDNIAYNNKDGILLIFAENSTIIRNNATNNINFGIKVDALGVCCGGQFIGWGYNNISQNKISYNGNGIYLYSRFDNVTENNILDNSNSGIFIKSLVCGGALFDLCGVESGELTIIQNRVENNSIGIHINSSRNNTFRSNFILNNNNGLILNDSRNMTIYDNYFMNLNNVIINGTNVWNTTKTAGSNILGGSYLGGNVWAEPDNSGFSQTSPDINGDGICDSGYNLDSNNTDYLPLRIITSNPPIVTNPSASHEIPDDTDNEPMWGETAQLNVTVTDNSGIASVTVDLSGIGGSSKKSMINTGGNIWSATTNAFAGTPPGIYNLRVNATNTYGISNTGVTIPLKVMKNGDTTGNNAVNIGDALRLANNVSFSGNPAYTLSSIYVADVNGNGVLNIGDALRLANNVSFIGNPSYILK